MHTSAPKYVPTLPLALQSSYPSDLAQFPPTKTELLLKFRHDKIHAFATPISYIHKDVLRLELRRTRFHRFIHWLLSQMPQWTQTWFGYFWPDLVLPSTLVLKKLKTDWKEVLEKDDERGMEMKLERESEFERERDTYAKMKSAQGQDIPILYGEVECEGIPAFLLSDVGGTALYNIDPSELSGEQLREMLEGPIRNLLTHNIEHDDLKLDNFHYIAGSRKRVVILDFGDVDPRSSDDIDGICKKQVDVIVRKYTRHQEARLEFGF